MCFECVELNSITVLWIYCKDCTIAQDVKTKSVK